MKRLFFVSIFSLLTLIATSQNSLFSVEYSIGSGTGNMREYIEPASFRGIGLNYRSFVAGNLGVGIEIGWNTFYDETPDGIYEYNNVTYAGRQWRYSNEFPVIGSVDYYFNRDGIVAPFVGFGLGFLYSIQTTKLGMYSFENNAFHLAIRPEAGVIIDTGRWPGFILSGNYFHGFEAGDLPSQAYFTLNAGIVFAW